jgi:hypothetical protein
MKSKYELSKKATTALEKESILKSVSLRNVNVRTRHFPASCHKLIAPQNVFWELDYSDVYSALSWERLHAYHGGLFKHLLGRFSDICDSLARSVVVPIETA